MNNSDQVKSHEVSNQDDLPQVLTVDEAAKLLRVGVGRVKSAVKKGEIPGVRRIGRNLRFHRDTLLRWLDGETGMAQASHGRTHDPIDEEAWDSDAERTPEELKRTLEKNVDNSAEVLLILDELAKLNRTIRRTCGARKPVVFEPDYLDGLTQHLTWKHLNPKAREAITEAARVAFRIDLDGEAFCHGLDIALNLLRGVNARLSAAVAQKGVAANG